MNDPSEIIKKKWEIEQNKLKEKLVTDDDNWITNNEQLKYIGGVDISFIKGDPINACAAYVILSYPDLKKVYEDYKMVKLTQPYIAGFLAFREVNFLVDLINKAKESKPELTPQIILVDGNGILHHRGFGLASHLGVLINIPTIGIGKNLLYIDGLNKKTVRDEFRKTCKKGGDYLELIGDSGKIWGAAYMSNSKTLNPIYISIGHKVSLYTIIYLLKSLYSICLQL